MTIPLKTGAIQARDGFAGAIQARDGFAGAIQGRDSFAAFMCDEVSLDILRPLIADLGWAAEKCVKGGLRGAVQSLSITSSPNILLVDLSESGDPLSDINGLAEVCEPGTIVIATGQVNDVRLYRDLLASGIHDYLLKPLSPGHLRDTLMQAQAIIAAPRYLDPAADSRHHSLAVIGTRGGCGASTIATSLAWLFSSEQQLGTGLLDLDIHFGTGALTLDLEPGRGLTDAVENPNRIDGLFIQRAMLRANDRLSILSAEAAINTPLITDGAAFVQLADELRAAFEMTVIDLPRNMLINFPQLLTQVSVIVLVTELTLASTRDAIRLLSLLAAHAPLAQTIVVTNKVQPAQSEFRAMISKLRSSARSIFPYLAKASQPPTRRGWERPLPRPIAARRRASRCAKWPPMYTGSAAPMTPP